MLEKTNEKEIKKSSTGKIIAIVAACVVCVYGVSLWLSLSGDKKEPKDDTPTADIIPGGTTAEDPEPEPEKPKFNITYYINEVSPPEECVFNGNDLTLPESVTLLYGYTFTGLYNEATGGNLIFNASGKPVSDVNSDMTLYAQYTPWKYTVNLDAAEGDIIDGEAEFKIAHDEILSTLPKAERYGYNFRGWELKSGKMVSDGENIRGEFAVVSGETYETSKTNPLVINLIAVYDKIDINVTFNYQGTDIPASNLGIAYGTTIKNSEFPTIDTGKKFIKGWSISPTEYIPYAGTKITENITLYAFWTEYKTVTLHRGDSTGNVSIKINEDDSFDLLKYSSAMIKDHYIPEGWFASSDYEGSEIVRINFSDAKTDYYFKWTAKKYTVNFDEVSAGKTIEPINYQYGERFDLEELTKKGHTFDGWYKTSSLSGTPIKFIDTSNSGDYTLYAGFTPKSYTITLDYAGAAELQKTVTVKYGDSYKLPVPEKHGYTFNGWYEAKAVLGFLSKGYTDKNGNSLKNYNHEENKNFYASWTLTTYAMEADYKNTVTALNIAGSNFPAKGGIDLNTLPLDWDYLISEGYKCKLTVNSTLVGKYDAKMTLTLKDASNNKIASTDWNDKVIKAGNTYDFSHTFDLDSSKLSSMRLNFEYEARLDRFWFAGTTFKYDVSNFEFMFEFYKP